MAIKRHQEPGEPTAEQVMSRRGWVFKAGLWELSGARDKRLQAGLVERIWQEQGPRKLELLAAQKERE